MSENFIDLMNNIDGENTNGQNPYENAETATQQNPYESSESISQNPYENGEAASQQNHYAEANSYVYTSGWMNTNSQQPIYRQPIQQSPASGQPVQQSVNDQPVYQQQSVYGQPVYLQPMNQAQYTATTGGGYYYVPAQYAAPVLPKTENKGLAIAGMVCGILSIVFCCLSTMAWYLAVPGLIMSIAAVAKKYKGRGMAIAGIICSSLGLILSVGLFVVIFLDMN